jgi:hypothetical protein
MDGVAQPRYLYHPFPFVFAVITITSFLSIVHLTHCTMKASSYEVNMSVLQKLLRILVPALGIPAVGFLIFWTLQRPAELQLELTIETQAPSEERIAGVEVSWLNSEEEIVGTTDEQGYVKLQIPRGGGTKGMLSIYHPEYRPRVNRIEIPTSAWKQGRFEVAPITLVRLNPRSSIQPALLQEIDVLKSELQQSRQAMEAEKNSLEEIQSPSMEDRRRLVLLRSRLEQLQLQTEILTEDSLLYTLREIDSEAMLRSMKRIQANYTEIVPD